MMKSVREMGTVLSPYRPDYLSEQEGGGTDEPGGPMASSQEVRRESQSEGLLGRIVVESGGNVGSLF